MVKAQGKPACHFQERGSGELAYLFRGKTFLPPKQKAWPLAQFWPGDFPGRLYSLWGHCDKAVQAQPQWGGMSPAQHGFFMSSSITLPTLNCSKGPQALSQVN